jgi:hypothetical protein
MARAFRGPDRNKLKKISQVMNALEVRDAIAANPKRTSAISTRTRVVDPTDGVLVAAWATLKARIAALLILNA